MAVANVNSDSVSILIGNGNGTFKPAVNLATGRNPQQIALGDFDRNGTLDVIAVNRGAGSVSVLLGNGAGSFVPAVNYAVGSSGSLPYSLAVGDFNGDGISDLAVTLQSGAGLSILLGRGDGTFAPAVPYPTGNFSSSIVAADFNHDGKTDLAVDGNDLAGTEMAPSRRPFISAVRPAFSLQRTWTGTDRSISRG